MFSLQAMFQVLSIFTLLNYATATSKRSDVGFVVSQLQTRQSTPGATYPNTTISFLVHDPVSIANTTAICSGSWGSNTSYPTGGYLPCVQVGGKVNNSNIAWNFEDGSFTSIQQFTLQIEHEYEDDAVGQYPYNYITNFAKTSVDTNQTICNEVLGSGGLGTICQQFANMTILAPIFASIAK